MLHQIAPSFSLSSTINDCSMISVVQDGNSLFHCFCIVSQTSYSHMRMMLYSFMKDQLNKSNPVFDCLPTNYISKMQKKAFGGGYYELVGLSVLMGIRILVIQGDTQSPIEISECSSPVATLFLHCIDNHYQLFRFNDVNGTSTYFLDPHVDQRFISTVVQQCIGQSVNSCIDGLVTHIDRSMIQSLESQPKYPNAPWIVHFQVGNDQQSALRLNAGEMVDLNPVMYNDGEGGKGMARVDVPESEEELLLDDDDPFSPWSLHHSRRDVISIDSSTTCGNVSSLLRRGIPRGSVASVFKAWLIKFTSYKFRIDTHFSDIDDRFHLSARQFIPVMGSACYYIKRVDTDVDGGQYILAPLSPDTVVNTHDYLVTPVSMVVLTTEVAPEGADAAPIIPWPNSVSEEFTISTLSTPASFFPTSGGSNTLRDRAIDVFDPSVQIDPKIRAFGDLEYDPSGIFPRLLSFTVNRCHTLSWLWFANYRNYLHLSAPTQKYRLLPYITYHRGSGKSHLIYNIATDKLLFRPDAVAEFLCKPSFPLGTDEAGIPATMNKVDHSAICRWYSPPVLTIEQVQQLTAPLSEILGWDGSDVDTFPDEQVATLISLLRSIHSSLGTHYPASHGSDDQVRPDTLAFEADIRRRIWFIWYFSIADVVIAPRLTSDRTTQPLSKLLPNAAQNHCICLMDEVSSDVTLETSTWDILSHLQLEQLQCSIMNQFIPTSDTITATAPAFMIAAGASVPEKICFALAPLEPIATSASIRELFAVFRKHGITLHEDQAVQIKYCIGLLGADARCGWSQVVKIVLNNPGSKDIISLIKSSDLGRSLGFMMTVSESEQQVDVKPTTFTEYHAVAGMWTLTGSCGAQGITDGYVRICRQSKFERHLWGQCYLSFLSVSNIAPPSERQDAIVEIVTELRSLLQPRAILASDFRPRSMFQAFEYAPLLSLAVRWAWMPLLGDATVGNAPSSCMPLQFSHRFESARSQCETKKDSSSNASLNDSSLNNLRDMFKYMEFPNFLDEAVSRLNHIHFGVLPHQISRKSTHQPTIPQMMDNLLPIDDAKPSLLLAVSQPGQPGFDAVARISDPGNGVYYLLIEARNQEEAHQNSKLKDKKKSIAAISSKLGFSDLGNVYYSICLPEHSRKKHQRTQPTVLAEAWIGGSLPFVSYGKDFLPPSLLFLDSFMVEDDELVDHSLQFSTSRVSPIDRLSTLENVYTAGKKSIQK
eukprot:gnl/Dysnectes_brevis/2897_a3539_811.p1 GENE.gnl/Dysnectes_brevis/2897_a3539_811~~gnl/Dysnectes_brevis/2897_a3539_811.p1  ORF type:complete len:1215 (-),score=115.36 gnl/Dysnectes_brevis/2897_a3539_811:30-3674(-)